MTTMQTQCTLAPADAPAASSSPLGKRKADTQDNERLSKRLSLLNLEKSGSKLYVPVESTRQPENDIPPMQPSDEAMQVDDSKHKVYIYDLDAELSDESDAEGEGKLVFLPDIERHLKENRIPPAVLANDDGELAGMQVVLYSDPKSLSVSEKHDGVRKAILQARHRLREKQRAEVNGETNTTESAAGTASPADDAMDMD